MANMANAKATYSSKVRLGNWSEDAFGAQLAANPRPSEKTTTVTKDEFPRHPESAYTDRAQPTGSRDSGTSFSEMFGHAGAAEGKAHFVTSDPITGRAPRRSDVQRKRAKELNSEQSVRSLFARFCAGVLVGLSVWLLRVTVVGCGLLLLLLGRGRVAAYNGDVGGLN